MSKGTAKGGLGVLIVDDSAVYRKILKDVLAEVPGTTLLATAPNGRIALEKIAALGPDVVLLDIEMPEMNGLETLRAIRLESGEVGVVMVSGAGKDAADVTVAALEMGALDFVTKPDGESMALNHKSLVERLTPILMNFSTKLNLSKVRARQVGRTDKLAAAPQIVAPLAERAHKPAPTSAAVKSMPSRIDVVAIGVSTGGPNALGVVIPALPANLGVPVLIVQHMPPVFSASLAKSLDGKSKLPVTEAKEGELIEANRIYVAPGGFHMVTRRGDDSRPVVGLNKNPPENSCRPAVDVMFRSMATIFGGNVLCVIMTGMGQDGLNGVRTLKQRGAYCITQDEATSTVYGMPLAVFKAGLSDENLPVDQIAGRIAAVVTGRRGR